MNAALFGHFVGFTLALGGFAYIVLAVLWAVRLQKRWPKPCAWLAIVLAAVVGLVTVNSASSSAEAMSGIAGILTITAFMIWREKLLVKAKADEFPGTRTTSS